MAHHSRLGRVWGLVTGAVLFSLGSATFSTNTTCGAELFRVSSQAMALHQSSLVFDGHNNLIMSLLRRKDVDVNSIDLTRFQQGLHTDIPRLSQGGLGAQFFATYVSADTVKKGSAVKETLEQIEKIKQLMLRYPEVWELALSSEDVQRLRHEKKIAGLIAIENGNAIDDSLAILRSYHQAGVRCMALSHDETHNWADAAMDKAKHGGLSKFGEQVVAEMNRLGMVIDLSHASDETIQDTMAVTRAPVVFSHSGVRAIAPHPRNISDETLALVAKNGGVVQVNFFAAFLTARSVEAYRERSRAAHELRKAFKTEEQYKLAIQQWLRDRPLPPTNLSDVVDHIVHVVKVAGIDHVGIGSNFDGMVSVPRDLEDVSCFPRLTQELMTRGFTPPQIRKILGENTLRVMREVERLANPSHSAPNASPLALRQSAN